MCDYKLAPLPLIITMRLKFLCLQTYTTTKNELYEVSGYNQSYPTAINLFDLMCFYE